MSRNDDEGGDPNPYDLSSIFRTEDGEPLPVIPPWAFPVIIAFALVFATVFLVAAVAFLLFPVLFAYAIPYIDKWLPLWWFRSLLVGLFLLIGFGFFLIRKHLQWLYGPVETFVGAVVCWAALQRSTTDHLAFALGVGTGIYVIVRGITNWDDGNKKLRDARKEREGTDLQEV